MRCIYAVFPWKRWQLSLAVLNWRVLFSSGRLISWRWEMSLTVYSCVFFSGRSAGRWWLWGGGRSFWLPFRMQLQWWGITLYCTIPWDGYWHISALEAFMRSSIDHTLAFSSTSSRPRLFSLPNVYMRIFTGTYHVFSIWTKWSWNLAVDISKTCKQINISIGICLI